MRKKSDSVTLRNEHLVSKIKDIKANHPLLGLPESMGISEIYRRSY